MKKVSTYYFLVLVLLNVALGVAMVAFNIVVCRQYKSQLGDVALPPLTALFVSFPWWPCVFATLFLGGSVLSIASGIKSDIFLHGVIVVLVAEAFILFCAMVAYVVPLLDMCPVLLRK